MNEWMNECVFIYRTYHIVSQGGLQFYLSEIGRQLVISLQLGSVHTSSEKSENAAFFPLLGLPFTVIRHKNGAILERSSSQRRTSHGSQDALREKLIDLPETRRNSKLSMQILSSRRNFKTPGLCFKNIFSLK